MIVPFSLIPVEYLAPIQVETTTEYTLEAAKFSGLNGDEHITQPALIVAPIYPHNCGHGLDNTILETGKSSHNEQEFLHDRHHIDQLTVIDAPTHTQDCEQGLNYIIHTYPTSKSITIEQQFCFSPGRSDSKITKHRGEMCYETPAYQQPHVHDQRLFQQGRPNQESNFLAPTFYLGSPETVIDLAHSPTESPLPSYNLMSYEPENMAISADRRHPDCSLPITPRVNGNHSETRGSYANYTEYIYGNNEFHGQTATDYYKSSLRYQEHVSISNTRRKRVYPAESSEDSEITEDAICSKRRRCETTVNSGPLLYGGDYIGLDLQTEDIPEHSYTNLTNVARFWNNSESINPFECETYMKEAAVQSNVVRPRCFRQC